MTIQETHPEPLPEFVFGKLSTVEGRARRERSEALGFYHNSILQPIDPRPGEAITITVQAGLGVDLQAATLSYTLDGTTPDLDSPATVCRPMERSAIRWHTPTWSQIEEWSAVIPGQPADTRVRYVLIAQTSDGRQLFSPHINLDTFQVRADPGAFDMRFVERLTRDPDHRVYEFHVDREEVPLWLRDAVIYQIFVDRFAPGPGAEFAGNDDLSAFLGGTLRGILSRLDYLSDLGVTCLWLTPIFPSPTHHGYDATDYLSVEPRLGTEEDFKELVKAAHARGIRILLDFVANHISNQHPIFVAASQDPKSAQRDWFFFRDHSGRYASYYDLPAMPIVNPDRPAVRDYLIGAANHWLELGCDGFRLDHAHGVTHGFWSAFRARTRAQKRDSVTIGEITDTPPVMRSYAGRMDGALDFGLLEILRAFFVFGRMAAGEFDSALCRHFGYFGESLALPSFLDNHDMNRFLWSTGGDQRKLRLAALCQFTLPGPPIIYYGTEVGLSQRRTVGRLEESRLPMLWGDAQDAPLLKFYQELVALRKRSSAEWSQPRRTIVADDTHNTYVYACGKYVVALNNGPEAVDISLPAQYESAPGGQPVLLLVTDAGVTLDVDKRLLHLTPFAGAVCRA